MKKKLTGVKNDQGKAKLSLINLETLTGIAKAMGYGMIKYNKNNYKGGMDWSRVVDACLRHTNAWAQGQDLDRDEKCPGCKKEYCDKHSGLNHLYHAGACINMLIYMIENKVGRDDR